MKYVLFALGLLLLFIGAYSVYFGSGIIEIERGWSSVIAGTTALVGGLLLVGIAWVINTLEHISAVLQMSAANLSVGSGASIRQAFQEASARVPAADLPMPAAAVSWPPHTFPVHAEKTAEETVPEAESVVAAEAPAEPVAAEMQQSLLVAETSETLRTPAAEPSLKIAPMSFGELVKPSVKDLWRRLARETEAKPSDERAPEAKEPEVAESRVVNQPSPLPQGAPVPEPAEQGESEPAAEHGDWLDHAFAEFDAALAQTAAPEATEANAAEPQAEEPAAAAPAEEPVSETAHHEFAAEPPPPMAHELASSEFPLEEKPAVIGRYDADGTNYIMYADGSIEAHSEHGVAHFSSMAELRAYFESQGTPQ